MIRLLGDPVARARREAAIALGRLGDPAAQAPLLAALGDIDSFVDWSVRRAIRQIGPVDVSSLREALRDPRRRDSALKLCDEWWTLPVANAMAMALDDADDSTWRARLVATLAGLYRAYPDWTGNWWGPNPLAGEPPRKTRDWDPVGMSAVLGALSASLNDPEPSVRREAIVGLIAVGRAGSGALRLAIDRERNAPNLALMARALGELRDLPSVPALIGLLEDGHRSAEVREAALTALEGLETPAAVARGWSWPATPGLPPRSRPGPSTGWPGTTNSRLPSWRSSSAARMKRSGPPHSTPWPLVTSGTPPYAKRSPASSKTPPPQYAWRPSRRPARFGSERPFPGSPGWRMTRRHGWPRSGRLPRSPTRARPPFTCPRSRTATPKCARPASGASL